MVMRSPTHPGELISENMTAVGWTVEECAANLGVSREAMSELLSGRRRVSPCVALALERAGWSTAEFWVRVQASYELARERQRQSGGEGVPSK